mgnify:CR=1 FL=1
MKYKIALTLFVLSSLLISGCTNFGKIDVSNLSEEDVNKINYLIFF